VDVSLSSWFVILLAVCAANLPFFSERLFAIIPLPFRLKPLWLSLLEMFFLYVLTGVIGYLLEARIGNVFEQKWEFYAITGCLFIVLAFPGFAFRYLLKRHI
jgi:hypothetical protein